MNMALFHKKSSVMGKIRLFDCLEAFGEVIVCLNSATDGQLHIYSAEKDGKCALIGTSAHHLRIFLEMSAATQLLYIRKQIGNGKYLTDGELYG